MFPSTTNQSLNDLESDYSWINFILLFPVFQLFQTSGHPDNKWITRQNRITRNHCYITVCVDVTGNHRRMPGSGNVVTRMVRSTHIICTKTYVTSMGTVNWSPKLVWRSGNNVGNIEVKLRRAQLVLGLVTTCGTSTISVFIQAHSGWPSSMGRCNEYWRWFRPLFKKKWRVLHSSRPCY